MGNIRFTKAVMFSHVKNTLKPRQNKYFQRFRML
nr:MAG TPA: hypothetical protein [Caudoviricetes sp.]